MELQGTRQERVDCSREVSSHDSGPLLASFVMRAHGIYDTNVMEDGYGYSARLIMGAMATYSARSVNLVLKSQPVKHVYEHLVLMIYFLHRYNNLNTQRVQVWQHIETVS